MVGCYNAVVVDYVDVVAHYIDVVVVFWCDFAAAFVSVSLDLLNFTELFSMYIFCVCVNKGEITPVGGFVRVFVFCHAL